ncbi:hypothetical protein P3T73_12745 [Kiritimatiellota bacterium B12222]|nr:hypothetical protein P3T73_12745 [Kiritimatiellota bacterium B12222]
MKMSLLLISTLFSLSVSASMIDWYCVPGSYNVTSEGEEMASNFRFELGIFKEGFTPSVDNMDQWAENWIPAQRALYNQEHHWFTSRYTVSGDEEGFTPGAKTWIWGFSGSLENAEWILLRNQHWVWPAVNPSSPLAKTWNMANADEVLVGGIGGAFVLQSAPVDGVYPPPTTWEQWKQENLGDDEVLSGVDANENGIPDLIEYVQGLDANGNLNMSNLRLNVLEDTVEISIPRREDRPATFKVQYSTDLITWHSAANLEQGERSELSRLIYTYAIPAETEPIKFWRYSVEAH